MSALEKLRKLKRMKALEAASEQASSEEEEFFYSFGSDFGVETGFVLTDIQRVPADTDRSAFAQGMIGRPEGRDTRGTLKERVERDLNVMIKGFQFEVHSMWRNPVYQEAPEEYADIGWDFGLNLGLRVNAFDTQFGGRPQMPSLSIQIAFNHYGVIAVVNIAELAEQISEVFREGREKEEARIKAKAAEEKALRQAALRAEEAIAKKRQAKRNALSMLMEP